MNSEDFERALLDVSKAFAAPEEIAERDDLTREQKVKLLQQWEYDVELLLVASEENMPSKEAGSEATGSSADLVQRIHRLLTELGASADPERSGPAKSTGVEVPGDRPRSKREPAKKSRAAS